MAQKTKWRKTILRSSIGSRLVALTLISLVKLIWLTLRVRHVNPPKLLARQQPPEPYIITLWHEFIPFILMLSPPDITVLNSSHADARILGYASHFVGAKTVWGSSNRNPLSSLRQLSNHLHNGRHALITPDGPRGPYRQMALGPIALSHLSGRPMVFLAAHASKSWRLNSWDKTQIPKPFSKVTFYWSDPITVPRTKDKKAQQEMHDKLEAELQAFSEHADRGGDD